MVIASLLLVLVLPIIGCAVALPFAGLKAGREARYRLFGGLLAGLIGLSGLSVILFQFVENTPALRAAFGNEAHEGIALGLGALMLFVMLPSLALSFLTFIGGRLRRRRVE